MNLIQHGHPPPQSISIELPDQEAAASGAVAQLPGGPYLFCSPRARCQPAARRAAGSWWPDESDDCTQGCVALQLRVTWGPRVIARPPPHNPPLVGRQSTGPPSVRTGNPLLPSVRKALARPALSLISALSNLRAHKCHHHLAVGVYRSLVTRKGLYPHPLPGLDCSLFCIFEESFLFLLGYNTNAPHWLSIQPAFP